MENKDVASIFNYLKSLPNKYKVKGKDLFWKFKYNKKEFSNSIDRAIHISTISQFYQLFLKKENKTTTLIPIPATLSTDVYEKLNLILNFINQCNLSGLVSTLMPVYIDRLTSCCLFEDYFPGEMRTFKGKSIIQIVLELPEVTDCESLMRCYKEITSNLSDVATILFMFNSEPIVYNVESFLSKH